MSKVKHNFMIGQRVIYDHVICTVCRPSRINYHIDLDKLIWVDNPAAGMKMIVPLDKVIALPSGQL